jgi:transposase
MPGRVLDAEEIGRHFGVSVITVHGWFARGALPRADPEPGAPRGGRMRTAVATEESVLAFTPPDRALEARRLTARWMRGEGCSIRQIAAALGMSRTAVAQYLR